MGTYLKVTELRSVIYHMKSWSFVPVTNTGKRAPP